MKKGIVFVLIILSILYCVKVNAKEIIIPDRAIRLRVIPNSNTTKDQWIKTEVRKEVEQKIASILKDVHNEVEAREILKKELPELEVIVEQTLEQNQIAQSFKVEYGMNYFPKKNYKGVIYEEGYYESLVITLGKGEGDNWWCVLFPPLCLLEAEETDEREEVEYKFFVKELLDRFFKNEK